METSLTPKKKCTITIEFEEGKCIVDCQTGGLGSLEIVNALHTLEKQFARKLVDEAKSHVGNDPNAIEKWLDRQYQSPDQN